jgi:hypothetical protein
MMDNAISAPMAPYGAAAETRIGLTALLNWMRSARQIPTSEIHRGKIFTLAAAYKKATNWYLRCPPLSE